MVHERRELGRADILHVIEIKSYTTLLGLIRNFSHQGFSFEMDSLDFKQKENIEFKLMHPHNNLSISFLGDVVWEKWIASTVLAGIKLRKMDKEMKAKLIEILCAIRDVPIDLFNEGNNSAILMKERQEEESVTELREKTMSETPKNYKSKLIPNFIIGLSISFFILSGITIYKALRLPATKTYYQTAPKELDPQKHLPKSENILKKPFKEQAESRILHEDTLSNKDKKTHDTDNESTIQVKSDKNIDTENTLNKTLQANDQDASRLVYTIQINSQPNLADAQKQFNFILQSLYEKKSSFAQN